MTIQEEMAELLANPSEARAKKLAEKLWRPCKICGKEELIAALCFSEDSIYMLCPEHYTEMFLPGTVH